MGYFEATESFAKLSVARHRPDQKAALEQEALDAKAKAGEGDKQQSEAVQ